MEENSATGRAEAPGKTYNEHLLLQVQHKAKPGMCLDRVRNARGL